jgi:hypothetical protein
MTATDRDFRHRSETHADERAGCGAVVSKVMARAAAVFGFDRTRRNRQLAGAVR